MRMITPCLRTGSQSLGCHGSMFHLLVILSVSFLPLLLPHILCQLSPPPPSHPLSTFSPSSSLTSSVSFLPLLLPHILSVSFLPLLLPHILCQLSPLLLPHILCQLSLPPPSHPLSTFSPSSSLTSSVNFLSLLPYILSTFSPSSSLTSSINFLSSRKDLFLGQGLVSLEALETKCETHACVDLMDEKGRKPSGGKLEAVVRLREPMAGKGMCMCVYHL